MKRLVDLIPNAVTKMADQNASMTEYRERLMARRQAEDARRVEASQTQAQAQAMVPGRNGP
ncbi:MAG: hypothetical protein AAF556_03480 [Pseudomonadota bacterium]